jgi:hypothetical protein
MPDNVENPHYQNARNLMFLLYHVTATKSLESTGFGFVSFCQTWEDKTPNFSMPSPHFQTRVYIKNFQKLNEFYASTRRVFDKNNDEILQMIKGYYENMKALTDAFVSQGYEEKFVNLDALWQNIQKTPSTINAFFLNGAPDHKALPALKEAHKEAKSNPFYVFIGASWEEYVNAKESKNLPSNFRAPSKIKQVKFEDPTIKEEVATSLNGILNYLSENKTIKTLFTSVPRKQRPKSLTFGKTKEGDLIIENCEYTLFNEYYEKNIMHDKTLEKLLLEFTGEKGTFMADVLSLVVARAYVLDEKSYPTKEAVGGIITNLETMEREKGNSGYGKYVALNTEGIDEENVKNSIVNDVKSLMEGHNVSKVFNSVTVYEDPLLNDVDDLFATSLIEKMSNQVKKVHPRWLNGPSEQK